MGYAAQSEDMLPDDKPKLINTGVAVEPSVLAALDEIVKREGVKSRNKLVGSFLKFAVEMFPLLRPLEKRISIVQVTEELSRPEAITRLIELGLDAYEKKHKR